MNTEQAFEIIEKGLNIANTKGSFLLRDATVIQQALDTLRQYHTPVNGAETEEVDNIPDEAPKALKKVKK